MSSSSSSSGDESSKKIIAVIGSTGAQGGSVISAILNDSKASSTFAIRAITRDASKPSAQKLKGQGCEVVEGDLSDKASLEKAFKGAYGVFGVTDFWATMSADIEIQQGKNVADAAKAAGVKHLVFSTLINVSEVSKGKLTGVTHFDSKANIGEYIKSIGIPASFFMPGYYMSNLPSGIRSNDAGALTWMLPIPEDSKVPVFDTKGDTGKYVLAIFNKGVNGDKEVFGKEFAAATRYMTPSEIVEAVAEVKGVEGHYIQVPYEGFKKALMDYGMPEVGAEDLGQNMLLMSPDHIGYYGGADVESVWKNLGIKPTELKDWVKAEWK